MFNTFLPPGQHLIQPFKSWLNQIFLYPSLLYVSPSLKTGKSLLMLGCLRWLTDRWVSAAPCPAAYCAQQVRDSGNLVSGYMCQRREAVMSPLQRGWGSHLSSSFYKKDPRARSVCDPHRLADLSWCPSSSRSQRGTCRAVRSTNPLRHWLLL